MDRVPVVQVPEETERDRTKKARRWEEVTYGEGGGVEDWGQGEMLSCFTRFSLLGQEASDPLGLVESGHEASEGLQPAVLGMLGRP